MMGGMDTWCQIPLGFALLLAACGGGASGGGPGPDGGALGDAGCAPTLGGADASIFDQTSSRLVLTGDATYLELTGAILDGPAIAFHVESDRIGACRLLIYDGAACDPACEAGYACLDGACVPNPAALSAGALTLRGIADAPVVVEPTSDAQYYWSTSQIGVLDVPAIRVEAAGGAVAPFALEACVAEPPAPIGDWSAAMAARGPGEDVTLAWSNPLPTARVYLRMTTGIGTHGGISPVEIECERRDTGALTLPGAFLDALYGCDCWSCGECGDNRLFRYHADEAEAGGTTVQLRTQSAAAFYYRP